MSRPSESYRVIETVRPRKGRERFFLFLTLLFASVAAAAGGYAWWIQRDVKNYYDTTGGVYEVYHSHAKQSSDKIVILTVGGVILDGKSLQQQLKRVQKDEQVKAIVLRVESPGGTVYGSAYMYHHLCEIRDELELPIVVSMGSIAASGGYYISMAVGEQEGTIFAEPATITGSIGVILPHYDVSGLMSDYNIRNDSIKSHDNKQMLSMTQPMSPEQRELVQAQIDESFEEFKSVILAGRPKLKAVSESLQGEEIQLVSPSNQRDLATGEVFTAKQALEFGLIDQIGFLEDAVARAAELASLEVDKCKVVRYRDQEQLIELSELLKASERTNPWHWISNPGPAEAWYLESPIPPFRPYPTEHEYRRN